MAIDRFNKKHKDYKKIKGEKQRVKRKRAGVAKRHKEVQKKVSGPGRSGKQRRKQLRQERRANAMSVEGAEAKKGAKKQQQKQQKQAQQQDAEVGDAPMAVEAMDE